MTKGELTGALQSLQAATVLSLQTLQQQARLLDLSHDAIFVWKFQGGIRYWNRAATELYGWTQEEVLGQSSHELLKTIHPVPLARIEESLLRDGHWSGELIHQTRDGRQIVVDSRHVLVREENDQMLVLETNRDLTERRQAEEKLRSSEARLMGVVESAMDAIITVDDQQCVVLFNHAAERMFSYLAAEVLGQPIERLIPARFRAAHEHHIRKFDETGETARAMGSLGAISGLRRNGEEFPIEASISQIQVGGKKLFTVILRDITARREAEARLVEQAALLDQSHEAIVVRDLDGRIRYWGRGAERLYGWMAVEAMGRTSEEMHYRKDSSPLAEATRTTIETGRWNGELRHVTKDGREVIVEGHWTLVRDAEGNPKNILAINTDITEKKKLEANFLRAQRLESIGTLASGIAHDLNNILSPIMMGAQMLRMKPQDDQSQRLLGLMQENANRGAEMIKQVLSFAKGIGGHRVVLQPKHLIREIIRIAEETFPKDIRIKQGLADDLWAVGGDATQLHQVLLNLCVNARDAMPQGGTLTIEAKNQPLDSLYAQMLKGANPGNFVVITVADTGVGISQENIDRIFDPFFTTKDPGQGTGLGLATVQGIVASHGGFITVESNPGIGTTFCIYLPAHDVASRQKGGERELEMPIGAGELILVVDDETAVREMTGAALEAFGYRALTADNGATALGVFATHMSEVSLVITDLMMPVMDGIATIRALRRLNPDIRIIASSGLADLSRTNELRMLQVDDLLEKPYSASSLLNRIAKALHNQSPSTTNS
ncbi:MAG: PAS domain S-box protein [Acidobacteriota bacterium]